MRNFFNDKYGEAYDLETMRQSPLTSDELREILPYQEDRTEYLRLFKELYMEVLLFQSQPELGLVKHNTYPEEIKKKYEELLEFCLLKNFFDYDLYTELGGNRKEWDKHYMPLGHLSVNVYRYIEYKSNYVIETLDEYRLKVEEFFAQNDNSYLNLRYNVSECFVEENGEYISKLFKYDCKKDTMLECTLADLHVLFSKIKNDLKECEHSISEIATLVPDENAIGFFEKSSHWFERRKCLDFEYDKLEQCLSIVENRLQDFSGDTIVEQAPISKFEKNRILYIYYGDLGCYKHKHAIIQCTAIVSGQNGCDIELNVEYCKDCDKYLLRYQSFEEYRKRYGFIIGNFCEVYNGQFNGGFDLALESPLKLSGYTVSQKDGLSQKERQYILATIIHNEIMNKGSVIRYLNYFIKMHGAKVGNEIAAQKWKNDLIFVQEYDKNIQPKVYISEIKKY